MNKSDRILLAQFFVVLLLAVATWLAVWQSLLWRIWWFDIPMHLLGGLWSGLCAAWLLARRGVDFSLGWCLAFALAVGLVWEIFEYSEGIAFPQYLSYPVDTVKDILMVVLGAVFGFLLARKLGAVERRGML